MSIEKIWKTKAGHKAVVMLVRNSHRCGYVGVPEGHPLYGKKYSDQLGCLKSPDSSEEIGKRSPIAVLGAALTQETNSMDYVFNVHGGITWSAHFMDPDRDKEKELTEIGKEYLEAGLDDGLWYIGYDCAHSGDGSLDPARHYGDYPVRSLEYCEAECESLSQQIIDRVIVNIGDQ